jgi:hypothetical protein
MVLVTTSWQRWAAGLAVSLVVFLVLYLTVIQPSTNTANQAVKAGMQQTQQAIKQAQAQINSASASNPASAASGHANKQVAAAGAKANQQLAAAGAKANQQLNEAGKLAACVSAAGTDTGKLQACQVKYTP